MEYDIIGDIHGYAAPLEALLTRLGYLERASGWTPPTGRQAIFLGDLIDRGPQQLKVIDIVRRMVDNGQARCIMGNHELNAIGWVTPQHEPAPHSDSAEHWLRPHTENKRRQHQAFLEAVGEGSALHQEIIDWFRTLPVALDLGGIRTVHAWWHEDFFHHIQRVQGEQPLAGELLYAAFKKGSDTGRAYDGLTKGYELRLPAGHGFKDRDGHERHEIRTQWWNDSVRTFREIAVIEDDQRDLIPMLPLPEHFQPNPVAGSPVFVGHYWLKGPVTRRNAKLACLDFSVAKGGPLVGYRWRGESEIDDAQFVVV